MVYYGLFLSDTDIAIQTQAYPSPLLTAAICFPITYQCPINTVNTHNKKVTRTDLIPVIIISLPLWALN